VNESIKRGDSLTLMTGWEAVRLIRSHGPFGNRNVPLDGIEILNSSSQARKTLRASRYVLAAGAIGSPVILLRSGFDHPLIGRNYMMHYSPLSVGVFLRRTEADATFVKQVGLSDFYFGTADLQEKMGIVQSLPAPGPLMMSKAGLDRVPRWVLKQLRARMLPLVGIVEDLPNPDNRVSICNGSGISLDHKFSDFDVARGKALEAEMSRLLRLTGAVHCVGSQIPSREHVAHQCGTLRFGMNRESAVADRNCRLFDQSDVFVADGSFMPTSLGVGPSLTIIGNALRVARTVTSEC
jgi:choline dehydrogenase-like flavoprotein